MALSQLVPVFDAFAIADGPCLEMSEVPQSATVLSRDAAILCSRDLYMVAAFVDDEISIEVQRVPFAAVGQPKIRERWIRQYQNDVRFRRWEFSIDGRNPLVLETEGPDWSESDDEKFVLALAGRLGWNIPAEDSSDNTN